MKFRTAFDTGKTRYYSSAGSRYRNTYTRSVDPKDGETRLILSGIEDVYDSIQKAAVGNTIDDLIRRATSGDTTAIGDPIASYPDLTNAPKDMLEAHQRLELARQSFNSFPLEVRSKFSNDFGKFIAACADSSVYNSLIQPLASDVKPETFTADEITKIKEMIGGNVNA